ncbi:unnamed protein product [Prorocentrum cordatum]|uniref:N-acetyltransferase domain-containing protein n=1 Tax=Prorocentrum cordatum TaxID=2364126 RepID=A0ABN9T0Z7_9DINO|nr:unnamed protein product [Polarella glacialis]
MAEQLATKLRVPPERLEAFLEVYESQGERGSHRWEELLAKVRSGAEVRERIAQRPELLGAYAGAGERALARAMGRLVFCGRYSAKAGTDLDDALDAASAGLAAAAATAEQHPGGKVPMLLCHGVFGDEHAACRRAAYPYRPSVSASAGSRVIEARCAGTEAVDMGALLGYVAMQGGGYIDDISVSPAFHGQGVAVALIAGAAAVELAQGSTTLALDVRAANTPAITCYKSLGFAFGPLRHPGFLDWDGGYEGEADARTVASKLPPHADLSRLLS